MSKYYYLVAGLPELTLEDRKLSYTVADFKTELYPAMSEDDKKLIDLFGGIDLTTEGWRRSL